MSYGPIQCYAGTIASGASSGTVSLGSKSYSRYFLRLPTMSTAAEVALQGSFDGVSYAPCFQRPFNTATTTTLAVVISSGVASSGGMVEVPVFTPYLKLITSDVVSGGVAFKVYVHD